MPVMELFALGDETSSVSRCGSCESRDEKVELLRECLPREDAEESDALFLVG